MVSNGWAVISHTTPKTFILLQRSSAQQHQFIDDEPMLDPMLSISKLLSGQEKTLQ